MDRLALMREDLARRTKELHTALEQVLVCRRGCADCCVDDLTVWPLEAELIREHHQDLLRDGEPHRYGACAFLDEGGACRIYEHRPYVCRTQGLPLRWLEDDGTESRDICPLNLDEMIRQGKDLEEIQTEQCWTLGPYEGALASLQAEAAGSFESSRVHLRSLFEKS